jgi:hypothetical protein
MGQTLLCVRQSECPYNIRKLANVHLTFAVGERPVGESHIGELPATLQVAGKKLQVQARKKVLGQSKIVSQYFMFESNLTLSIWLVLLLSRP